MATRLVREHLNLVRINDFLVVHGNVIKQSKHVYFLLKMAALQVGIGLPCNRKHGRLIQFRVIQSVQKMNSARPGCGQATTKLSRIFCMGTSHEGRSLFMSNLNKAHAITPRAQRLHNSIDAVTGQPENCINSPVDNVLYEYVSSSFSHHFSSFVVL